MDINKFEQLKKKIDDYNTRVVKVEATRNIVSKNVKDILNKYGISDVKDYKKIIDLRDSKSLEVTEYIDQKQKELEDSQTELIEVENIIAS